MSHVTSKLTVNIAYFFYKFHFFYTAFFVYDKVNAFLNIVLNSSKEVS